MCRTLPGTSTSFAPQAASFPSATGSPGAPFALLLNGQDEEEMYCCQQEILAGVSVATNE
jgi:hypothetical protein